MRDYGQFCPIARASEVLAERWTPIIVRNVLLGSRTFNQISAGAPGLSRALLARRLHELERAGVIRIEAKPDGHGSLYEPTQAGRDLAPVLEAMGGWAERWVDVRPEHAEHADPGHVVASWCLSFLDHDRLPAGRVLVRFDYQRRGRPEQCWLLIQRGDAEVCRFDPGFGDDMVVTVHDALTFTRWHLGFVTWPGAVKAGAIHIDGPGPLRRALPGWNTAPATYTRQRTQPTSAA
jgi:DNA-binding HxlR family transcriptional regulator